MSSLKAVITYSALILVIRLLTGPDVTMVVNYTFGILSAFLYIVLTFQIEGIKSNMRIMRQYARELEALEDDDSLDFETKFHSYNLYNASRS